MQKKEKRALELLNVKQLVWRSGEDPEKETENEHTLMQAEIKKEKLAMESNASISQVRLKKKKKRPLNLKMWKSLLTMTRVVSVNK